MSLLVVEDNPISAKAMQAALTRHGHETAVVYTGVQAFEYLEQNPQIECAVIDLILPEMDGFQLIRRMNRSDLLRDIPVVICTTLRDVEAVKRSARLGCRHYVVKPVAAEELVRKVDDALEQGMALLENKRKIMERLDLDEEAYNEVLRTFGKLLDEKMGRLYAFLEGRLDNDAPVELTDLAEGARLLGAQKLNKALAPFGPKAGRGDPRPARADYDYLVREMSAMERLLRPARRMNVVI